MLRVPLVVILSSDQVTVTIRYLIICNTATLVVTNLQEIISPPLVIVVHSEVHVALNWSLKTKTETVLSAMPQVVRGVMI